MREWLGQSLFCALAARCKFRPQLRRHQHAGSIDLRNLYLRPHALFPQDKQLGIPSRDAPQPVHKSRMTRECHVRFREGGGVRFLSATRLFECIIEPVAEASASSRSRSHRRRPEVAIAGPHLQVRPNQCRLICGECSKNGEKSRRRQLPLVS
jgi:hypothetical protein